MEEGFTHRTCHWFIFVVDTVARGGRQLVFVMSERVTVVKMWTFFDCETEGVLYRLFWFFGGRGGVDGGLQLTDMSRLQHWADPNVENKGEVYRTIQGQCWFLPLSVHMLIKDTLFLQSGTKVTESHSNLKVNYFMKMWVKFDFNLIIKYVAQQKSIFKSLKAIQSVLYIC